MIFKSQMTLSHLWPMNKKLECKSHQIYSKMLRKISKKETWSQFNHQEFIFWSTFCTYVLRTFLRIICWQFLVPRSERFLVNWFELNWVFFLGFLIGTFLRLYQYYWYLVSILGTLYQYYWYLVPTLLYPVVCIERTLKKFSPWFSYTLLKEAISYVLS